MAGKAHQKILGLVVRKMRQEGYEVISYDGNEKIISNITLHSPPYIEKHRPDALGINSSTNKLCIGEAKTKSDINSERTKEQLRDFSSVTTKDGESVKLIIGIPKSAEMELNQLLKKMNLFQQKNVSYIWVPDEFLINNNEKKDI